MGMMKQLLMEKIAEYADLHHLTEEQIYKDDELYALATEYADQELKRLRHIKP